MKHSLPIRNSIQWQLQLWHGVMLVLVLVGFGYTALRLQQANEMRRVDEELELRANALMKSMREGRPARPPPPGDDEPPGRSGRPPPPSGFRLPAEHVGLFSAQSGFYFLIWRRDGPVMGQSDDAPENLPRPANPSSSAEDRGVRDRGMLREVFRFTPPGECILVGRSIAAEQASLQRFALRLVALGAGVLALGLAGGWWLAGRAIRPIRDISATAERIAGGDLSQRIPTADSANELGQLAAVLNSTFARLESSFAQQAQFTADASHELRTPVSVLLSQTQSALTRERSPAEYRETLEACQRAAQRMRRLIESLLALARLDAGEEKMNRSSIDVARVVEESLDLVQPLAKERQIQVQADLRAARCQADAERIGLVFTNLLTNAIHHNRAGGEVRVGTRAEGGMVIVTVSDNGPGIAAEHLPHIFDRFYRADAARTVAQGRTGLGLAISKAIIEAHGGTIEVGSVEGSGTTFTVRLGGG